MTYRNGLQFLLILASGVAYLTGHPYVANWLGGAVAGLALGILLPTPIRS